MEPMRPEHLLLTDFQVTGLSFLMRMLMLYSSEPLTMASIRRGWMSKWQTEPLRA